MISATMWRRMQNKLFHIVCIAFIGLLVGGCAESRPATGSGGAIHERNQGYSLLYKLMSDESQVGGIFVIKGADASVQSLVKEIGTACQDFKKQMDTFPKGVAGIEFDVADLPPAEAETRKLIAGNETHTLLFSSGKEFELNLLLTQVQAMSYATYLSKAIEQQEDDPGRKKFLTNLSVRSAVLHDRVVKMIGSGV
jgi:hypothetical protein